MMGDSGLYLLLRYAVPGAMVLLAALWLVAVLRIRGRGRRALLLAGCAALLLAAVLLGGEQVLNLRALSWRQWVRCSLMFLMWWAVLLAGGLTVYHIPRVPARCGRALSRGLRAGAALCLCLTLLGCTAAGALSCWPAAETVIVYRGVKAVQEDSGWLDGHHVIYAYHSPLTRSSRPIGPVGG